MTMLGWLVTGSASLAVAISAAFLFIPRELWKRWRPRIVDHVDRAARRKVTRFGRRYREFMMSSLRLIDLKGLATVGFYTPELDEVFVDVSLVYRAPHQIPEGVLTQPPTEVTDRRSISEFLDHAKPVVLAVVGVPGSGKTTLLRYTARAVCRQRRGRRRSVPILLYLRDHVTKIVADPQVALPTLVVDTLGRMGRAEPPGWFEQRLRDGDCVVLLDGLDEVAKQEERTKVAAWVAEQTRQYPRNDFVVTSRPQGYRSAPIDGALVLQVRSFTDDQVSRFVHDWYLAMEKLGAREAGAEIRVRAHEAADDLLKRLDANPALYDLTINPLLLTMIANVHRFRGALPGSRTDLYAEICQVMLSRRQEAKNLPVELSGDKKESLLRTMAYTMMQRRVRDLPRAEIHELMKTALRRLSTRMTERELLTDLSSNGLLIEREADKFSFAHLTFQEYLASAYIRDKGLVQVLADTVDDIWWRETTLLYVTRSDADPIVEACLNSGSITALTLAFDIDDQDSDLAPELRKRLDNLLLSGDADRQIQWTGALVARQIGNPIRTSAGGRVYTRPISTVVYKSFQKDTGTPAPDGPVGGPNEPVRGIRGRDAVKFLRWINGVTGEEPRYRRPTRAEINDPAVQRALGRPSGLSVWLESGEEPELWTPAGSDHPNHVDSGQITDHVLGDFERSKRTVGHLLLLRSRVATLHINYAYVTERTSHRTIERTAKLAAKLIDGSVPTDESDLDHALAIDQAVMHAHAPRTLDPSLFGAAIMESTLGRVLTRTFREGTTADDWPRRFAQNFVLWANIAGGEWVVSLDSLADNVRESRAQLFGRRSEWAYQVARRLEETASPIIDRAEPLTPGAAARIRIAALCLAAEADRIHGETLGDKYREIAAGITLMERRTNGAAPVTETVMLAMA